MVTFLSPQVAVRELETKVRNIRAVSTSTAAFLGLAVSGPIAKSIPLSSFDDFVRIFGGPMTDAMLYWAVKGFYENCGEGSLCYAVRTAHYTTISNPATLTAVAATINLKDTLNVVNTLKVEASSPGTWGNTIQVTTQLASRFATNTTAAVNNGSTSVGLVSTAGVRVGTVLHLNDGTDSTVVVVTKIENLTIFFAAVSGLAAAVDSGADAFERSFNLIVSKAGVEIERHEYLSMEDTNAADYVEARINPLADTEQSTIRVTDLDTTNGPSVDRPLAVTLSYLSGGNDGLTGLTDGDFVGNSAAQNGLYAFEDVETINMIGIPEAQTQVVQIGIIDYCETRKYPLGILSSPLGLDVTGIINYVNNTLAANTSRSAMYYPQLKVFDPDIDNTRIVPCDGHVAGIYARVDQNIGIQQVGAGELGQIRGIIGFENDLSRKKGLRDLLYPNNVNSLLLNSSLGRCIFGSRTLSRSGGIGSQIAERRVFSFVEETLERNMQWVLFKANTPDLRRSVDLTTTAFLGVLRQEGVIEDFYVDVGTGLNNALVRSQGKLVMAVGIKAFDTIEFFDIQVSKDTRAQEAAIAELAS